MAIYGALGEGFPTSYGTRPGEFLSRGTSSGSTTGAVTITVPLPIRTVTYAAACCNGTTAPNVTTQVLLVTVGNISNNTFTVYFWTASTSTNVTLTTASVAQAFTWWAWGKL